MITMHEKLKKPKKFLNACKKHSKNEKIALQSKFIFTIEEILQIMKEAESINATKSVQKQLQKRPIQTILENDKNDMPNNKSNNSDSDCIIVSI